MRKLLGVYCGVIAATAVLSAQTPQPPATSSTSTTTRQSQPVTIVGCVMPDLTSDPTAASTTSHRFILSNIQAPTAGTSEQSRNSAVTGYILMPSPDVSLGEHLNHKVQITGTVDSSTTTTSSTTQSATPSSSTTQSTRSTSVSMPTFRVTSVKMLSETCP